MSLAIVLLLIGYVLYTLTWNFRHRGEAPDRLTPLAGLLQAPLMLFCVYYAFLAGAFDRNLVHLGYIAAGLLLGQLVFALSIWITQRDWRDAWGYFVELREMIGLLRENPGPMFRILSVAITEEVLYRAAVQPILIDLTGSVVVGLVLTVGVFAVVHEHFFQNSLLQSTEFVAFALLLGLLYYLTGSLVLVAAVHSVRNLGIFYIEYRVRSQELGDHAAAQDEIDAAHRSRVVRHA